MSFADRHNKGGVLFDIDIKDFKFVTLKELYEKDKGNTVFGIEGLYINSKSKYGDHPVAICVTDRTLVDLPSHLTEEVKEILKTPGDVELIKSGKVGFHVETYIDKKFGRECYGIKWEDMN